MNILESIFKTNPILGYITAILLLAWISMPIIIIYIAIRINDIKKILEDNKKKQSEKQNEV